MRETCFFPPDLPDPAEHIKSDHRSYQRTIFTSASQEAMVDLVGASLVHCRVSDGFGIAFTTDSAQLDCCAWLLSGLVMQRSLHRAMMFFPLKRSEDCCGRQTWGLISRAHVCQKRRVHDSQVGAGFHQNSSLVRLI